MDTVKLIIWDLDETFWKGTISDNEVIEKPNDNIELVKHLTDRGIVNSICSKNDFSVVEEILKKWEIWDYFVFPSIDWTPKGGRIKNIIENMNLRPVNCLFVDDNVHNLEEASYVLPKLQTATPCEFQLMLGDEAFKGKDDSTHERLKQYKILEKKVSDREGFSSNQEFLSQSNIEVELITDCTDKLERIHEMIHRNNQLNFTKDRITKEEVENLFSDTKVNSGVVRVTDKYGDHGIVGCYAVKDGKALQLVLSCRILGMGVEQWLYARLGFPYIEVRGEVAAKLNKSYWPEYIHEKKTHQTSLKKEAKTGEKIEAPILLYGNCQVRQIWGFVSDQFSKAKFEWLDPGACVCNLAAVFRYSRDKIDYMLSNVPSLSKFTFDEEVATEKYQYIIASLNDFCIWRKYENKSDGSYFYSGIDLNEKNSTDDFCSKYIKKTVSPKDIEADIEYLCKKIGNAKLVLLNCPEIRFPGNLDKELEDRLAMNRVGDRIAEKIQNVVLLDIRKHAKYLSDFFDASPNHFTRNVAHEISMEIKHIISPEENEKNNEGCVKEKRLPTNKIIQEENVHGVKIQAIAYLCNGILCIQINMLEVTKYTFEYTVHENGFEMLKTGIVEESVFNINIPRTAEYSIRVSVYQEGNIFYEFPINRKIKYSPLNYMQYVDPLQPGYEQYMEELPNFIRSNTGCKDYQNFLVSKMAMLMATGANIKEYFDWLNVKTISILTNAEIGKVLLPWAFNSGLNIRDVYTSDSWGSDRYGDDVERIRIKSLAKFSLPPRSVLVYAGDAKDFTIIRGFFREKKVRVIFLRSVLFFLMTRYFFTKRLFAKKKGNSPRVIALRFPMPFTLSEFGISKLRANERVLFSLDSSEKKMYQSIKENYEKLPHLQASSLEKWEQTIIRPHILYHPQTRVPYMEDMHTKYVNIRDGFRVTTGQPWSAMGDIYIFGNKNAFGVGCADDETIASHLQRILGRSYRVHNYANHWHCANFHFSFWLYDNIDFKENDIVVFLIHPNQSQFWATQEKRWLRWQYMETPVIKVDALPLFTASKRKDYFISPDAINAEGNMECAKLLRDAIHENILSETDLLYGKIVEQVCRVDGNEIHFKFVLRDELPAVFEFSLYKGNVLWEKLPPKRNSEAVFHVTEEMESGEYHISYKVRMGECEQIYRTKNFIIRR